MCFSILGNSQSFYILPKIEVAFWKAKLAGLVDLGHSNGPT